MKFAALTAFCAAVILWIPLEWTFPGIASNLLGVYFAWKTGDRAFLRRMSVLLGCVALLGWANINTSTHLSNIIALGPLFLAVILLPPFLLRKSDPDLFSFQFFPKRISKIELAYTALAGPLAWLVFWVYFNFLSPMVPFNWHLSNLPDSEELSKLFIGVNAVGIWDELFFINTSFVILRSLFRFWPANIAQSVLYSAVLYDMAFRGWGLVFVPFLAITQGIMFERSKALVYVLAVHLIVDYFLYRAILNAHYPGVSMILSY